MSFLALFRTTKTLYSCYSRLLPSSCRSILPMRCKSWAVGDCISPMYNKVIKEILGRQEKVENTRRLIEAVTSVEVQGLSVENSTLHIDILSQSQAVVDVLCKTTDGEQVLIEIQTYYDKAFRNRLHYYASKLFSSQVLSTEKQGKPIDYDAKLKKVVVIAFSRYPLWLKNEKYVSTVKLLDVETLVCEIPAVTYHLIDLSKFNKDIDQLSTNLDAWTFFFKYVHTLEPAVISRFCQKHPLLKDVVRDWDNLKLSPEEYREYLIGYEMNESVDLAASIARCEQDVNVAIDKAVKKTRISIAEALINSGTPVEEALKNTGLVKEDLEY